MVTAQTTREMRGMAIANTIGRRNNPDVSIQRLNNWPTKSNHNQTMISGMLLPRIILADGHVIAPTLRSDISNVSMFTRLNLANYFERKSISIHFQTFQLQKAELGEIICQKCGSANYKKFGVRHNKDSTYSTLSLSKIVHIDSS